MNEALVALNVKINEEDSGATTLREYFKIMLKTIFKEGEGFSGKRPFGNSSWEHSLAIELVKSGVLDGKLLDDDDYFDAEYNSRDFDKLINLTIDAL